MTDDSRVPEEARTLERVRDAYARTPALDASARARLDRALARLPAPRHSRRGLGWLVAPRAKGARLVTALALMIVVAAGAVTIARVRTTSRGAEVLTAPLASPAPMVESGTVNVRFVFLAPQASRVAVVGDFNGWDAAATPMERLGAEQTWSARVPLPPGAHDYAFVVDGDRWVTDPVAPLSPLHEFGPRNSIVIVGESAPS